MANLKRRSFIAALGAAAPFALPLLAKSQLLDSNSTFKQTFDDPLNSHSIATTDLNTATATAIISLRGKT